MTLYLLALLDWYAKLICKGGWACSKIITNPAMKIDHYALLLGDPDNAGVNCAYRVKNRMCLFK